MKVKNFRFFGKRQILLFWPLNPDNLMEKKKIEISKKNSVGSTKDGKVFFLTANYIFGYCWVTDGAKNNFMTIVGEKFEIEKFFDFFGKRQILLFWPLNPYNLMEKKKLKFLKKIRWGQPKTGKCFFWLQTTFLDTVEWLTEPKTTLWL